MKEGDDHRSQGPIQDRGDEAQIHPHPHPPVLSPASFYGKSCSLDLASISIAVRGRVRWVMTSSRSVGELHRRVSETLERPQGSLEIRGGKKEMTWVAEVFAEGKVNRLQCCCLAYVSLCVLTAI